MKWFKRIFLLITGLIVLFVGSVAFIGTQYEKEIIDYVKHELGKQLNREVKVGKIEYSLFSSFPNVSVDLINLETYSYKLGDVPFVKLNKLHLVFDIIPLIQGEFEVGKIILEEGEVNIIYNNKGDGNFNIIKDSPNTSASKKTFSVERVQLNNVSVSYQNWKEGDSYKVDFDDCVVFPSSIIDSVKTKVELVGNAPFISVGNYVTKKPINLDGELQLLVKKESLNFKYYGQFGSGEANLEGWVGFLNTNQKWDFKFELLNQNTADLLATLPNEFKNSTLSSLNGNLSAEFTMKGEKSKSKYPPINVAFNFSNGLFQVEKEKFSKIFLKGVYYQPNAKNISGATFKIDNYSLNYSGIDVSGNANIKELKRPIISAKVQSSLDLHHLHDLILKDEFKVLTGSAYFDMNLSGRLVEIFQNQKKKDLKLFKSSGSINLSNVKVQPVDFDYPIEIKNGKLDFSNSDLLLDSFTGKILSSSFSMNGRIKSYLKTIFEDEPLSFDADLKMDKMILDEFVSDTTSHESSEYQFNLPKSIRLKTNLELGEFRFRKFIANQVVGQMSLNHQELSFKNVSMNTCDGTAHIVGVVNAEKPDKILFNCSSDFQNIDAEKAFAQFENFGQDVLLQKHVKGRISIKSILRAESDKQLNVFEEKIQTESQLLIHNGELISFEPLVELQEFLKEELKLKFNLSHLKFETLKNNININNGVITIPEMAIRSSDINLDVSGKHSFNQDIDYLLKIKHNEIFKANKQNKIDAEFGVVENNDKTATLPLRMKGNIEDPKFSYDTKEKINLISKSWKQEGKQIKKVFIDEFGGIFKSKKDKSTKDESDPLNNSSSKTQTIIHWDEDEDEDEDEE